MFRCLQCVIKLCEIAVCLHRYKQEFGFVIPGRKILVDDVRVRGIGRTHVHTEHTMSRAADEPVSDMVSQQFD